MRLRSSIAKVKGKTSTSETAVSSYDDKNKPHSIEVLKHSKNYSELLDIYVQSTHINTLIKIGFKILFFLITMGSMVVIIYLFYLSLRYAFDNLSKFDTLNDVSIEAILSIITVVLPTISSLIVAFMKLPEIIAQYLFNVKEDNYMNSIIKNIQDYGKSMFAMEHKIDELLMNNKDKEPETDDENIEDSPIENAG